MSANSFSLSSDEVDILRRVVAWTGSYDLYHLVRRHVEAVLCTLDRVTVADVNLAMSSGSSLKRYTTSNVKGVSVKLSNEGVIHVSVETSYRTVSVLHLAGHEKQEEIDEELKKVCWYVYVVRCSDNSLYCGVSKNVDNRVKEHNGNSRGAKYTRSRRPVTLVRSWKSTSRSEALKAEKRFKKLSKKRKEDICNNQLSSNK